MESQDTSQPSAPVSMPKEKLSINTPTAILIAGTVIAFAIVLTNTHFTLPSTTGAVTQGQQPGAIAVDSSKVKTDNEPFIGNANAPVTMAYWFDYQCPFCQQNEETSMPQIIKNYVNTGKVKIVYKDFAFLGPDSQKLGQYARAVWEAAPAKFYAWHKAIYDSQGQENSGWATDAKISSVTSGVLGDTLTAQVVNLVKTKGADYQSEMDADKTEGESFGVTGTPAAVIGTQLIPGAVPYQQVASALDTALAVKK